MNTHWLLLSELSSCWQTFSDRNVNPVLTILLWKGAILLAG